MEQPTNGTNPVSDPTITLDGVEYTIRYRAGDVRRLSEEGIDLFGTAQTFVGQEAVKKVLLLFKHGVAHSHPNLEIADLEDKIDLSDLTRISMACQEAQLKASAQASASTGKTLERFKRYGDQIRENIPEEFRTPQTPKTPEPSEKLN